MGEQRQDLNHAVQKPKKEQNIVVKCLRVVGISILAFIVIAVGQLLGDLIVTPLYGCMSEELGETFCMYFMFIGIWIVLFLLLLIIKPYRWIIPLLTHKRSGNNLKHFGIGLAIGFGMNVLCIIVALLHGDIKIYFDRFTPWFFLIFAAVCVQSGAEEVVCRGFMYEKFNKLFHSGYVAAVLNGAFFGILHASNPGFTWLSLINICATGFLFSVMVMYFDGYFAAIAAHTAWNFTQAILFGLPNSGHVNSYTINKLDASTAMDSFCYNVGFGVEGTILADVVLVAMCVVFVVLVQKKRKKETLLEG